MLIAVTAGSRPRGTNSRALLLLSHTSNQAAGLNNISICSSGTATTVNGNSHSVSIRIRRISAVPLMPEQGARHSYVLGRVCRCAVCAHTFVCMLKLCIRTYIHVWMRMCVYVYIYIIQYVHVCVVVCLFEYLHISIIYIYMCIYRYSYFALSLSAYSCRRMHVCMYVCMCLCMYEPCTHTISLRICISSSRHCEKRCHRYGLSSEQENKSCCNRNVI